jgi:hypothetical protein
MGSSPRKLEASDCGRVLTSCSREPAEACGELLGPRRPVRDTLPDGRFAAALAVDKRQQLASNPVEVELYAFAGHDDPLKAIVGFIRQERGNAGAFGE